MLGVPLITVPDSSPRASKGVLVLTWRICRTFLRGDRPFSVTLCSGGCARAHPPGVAPEASEEWFDSSEVLILFFLRCLGRPCCSLMWPGRSPGAWSGSESLGWFVDAVNSLAVAGLREQPPSLCTEREDDQGLSRLSLYAPSLPFRKEEGGKAPCYPRRAPNMVSPVSC